MTAKKFFEEEADNVFSSIKGVTHTVEGVKQQVYTESEMIAFAEAYRKETLPDAKVYEAIEKIQQAIVEAGGTFLPQRDIRKMSVEELLQLTTPNNIKFMVSAVQK